MDTTTEALSARRIQGFAAHLAASGMDKQAAQDRIKKYAKQAGVRDRKHEAIRKTILGGLNAQAA